MYKRQVVYIFGDNENEIRDVLIEKLSASNISCKRVGGQEIIERCHEDINAVSYTHLDVYKRQKHRRWF